MCMLASRGIHIELLGEERRVTTKLVHGTCYKNM